MKVKVIGKYGRYCPKDEATNCYLITTDLGKNILIDFGSGALSKLQKYIDITSIDMVIITHLHFDHACDLGVLQYALGYLGANKIPVYMPNSPKLMFDVFSSNMFDIKVLNESVSFCVDNITFQFVKSPHPVETYAVIMTAKGKKVVYTSDCSDGEVLSKNTMSADIVIGDACILDSDYKIGAPHVSVRTLAESVPKNCKLYLAHLTCGDEDKILSEALAFHVDSEIICDFEI